jgi:hypothetical protein
MNFSEARQLIDNGQKVRRADWRSSVFLYLDGDTIRNSMGSAFTEETLTDIAQAEWLEYQEPS